MIKHPPLKEKCKNCKGEGSHLFGLTRLNCHQCKGTGSPTPAKKEDNSSPMTTSPLNSSKKTKSEPVGEEVKGWNDEVEDIAVMAGIQNVKVTYKRISNLLHRQKKELVEKIKKGLKKYLVRKGYYAGAIKTINQTLDDILKELEEKE